MEIFSFAILWPPKYPLNFLYTFKTTGHSTLFISVARHLWRKISKKECDMVKALLQPYQGKQKCREQREFWGKKVTDSL